MILIYSSCRKSSERKINSLHIWIHHLRMLPIIILLKKLDMLGREHGSMSECLVNMILHLLRVFRMIRQQMKGGLLIWNWRKKMINDRWQMVPSWISDLESWIYSVFISQMVENLKWRGRGNSYSIVNLRSIWILFESVEIRSSGEVISIVLIMRSILLVRRRMMEK